MTLLLGLLAAGPGRAEEAPGRPPIPLRVVGFYAHAGLFAEFEEPFWAREVPRITDGRLLPSIAPLETTGIRESELLSLIRLGVLPVATVPLALAAGDDPELSIVDLPGLNPDMATLRRSLDQWRDHLASVLEERYDIRLLALLIPTTQVVFCREPFTGLGDLAGRRIRVGAIGQADLLEAVHAVPRMMPLSEVVTALRARSLDCAITGSLPGNRIGLAAVTSHVSRLPVNWFVSAVVMNGAVWRNLPEPVRAALATGLARMEQAVLAAAEVSIEDGFACNAGRPRCSGGSRGQMVVVDEAWAEPQRRRLLETVLLPQWLRRCGADCAAVWNRIAAPAQGIWARPVP
ncbi:TRAP transporter substrate-binding protein DctP [Paeniroseomonas aquatica]|uniref:TRAP transporter substrate-binding protein DctP n=1 Tax=Paeniroseomonas aquatica TaxID=373043 RepID=A0ABT8A6C9_9PROT|nr:TRAP transporter substrate-binding protein DctP [Paeniroseomonas aquatica]MDN3565305.1 TRAP transporter substrate-binding protein DctP [Paeniroseomonas aquatica]